MRLVRLLVATLTFLLAFSIPAFAGFRVEPLPAPQTGFQAVSEETTETFVCDPQCILWIDATIRQQFTDFINVLHENELRANPFLTCTRSHESGNNPPTYDNGYGAVSHSGRYRGAYQFDQGTWNSAAQSAGRPDLIGFDPAAASPKDQDLLAWTLYQIRGARPWLGRCAGL